MVLNLQVLHMYMQGHFKCKAQPCSSFVMHRKVFYKGWWSWCKIMGFSNIPREQISKLECSVHFFRGLFCTIAREHRKLRNTRARQCSLHIIIWPNSEAEGSCEARLRRRPRVGRKWNVATTGLLRSDSANFTEIMCVRFLVSCDL